MAKELEFTLITETVSQSDAPQNTMINLILTWVIEDLSTENTTD